jgi:hypothetical protein
MLGRFLGYDGTEENKPAARFGHLAMAPTVPIKHPWASRSRVFLSSADLCPVTAALRSSSTGSSPRSVLDW